MKVAYVTTYDAHDPTQWSGTGYHIAKALETQGVEVVYVGPLEDRGGATLSARQYWHRLTRNRRFLRERDLRVAKAYATQIEEQLRGSDVDIVLSPGTIPIAVLHTSVPVAFWTDATFAQMVGLYPEFEMLAGASIESGNAMERHALASASLAIYASDWAARSAVDDYGAAPSRVKVVPFGANIDCDRDADAVATIVDSRATDVCRLLFVGVDWHRKGGDIALRITAGIAALGVPVELTVVGSEPDIPAQLRDVVLVRGYIDKSTTEGRRELDALFARSHFLLMPSRAECFGIVFCEASSFGLPSIASTVGGIPSAVTEGRNGHLFPISTIVESSAVRIADLWRSPSRYRALCATTFAEYEERLNWGVAGAICHAHLDTLVRSRVAASAALPRVTVITVVYNGAGHIEETIRAVASQSYANLDYIVVDGGSTDGTVAILERCDDLIDRWVSEPDAGLYDAMNKAVAMVSDPSSYIIFAHSDDTLHSPDAIERVVELGMGADLVYGRMLFVDGETSGVMGRRVDLQDLARETLCHPATLVRRHVFDSVGQFDTSFRVAADYDHIVRCFAHPVTTRFADVIVTRMRMGGLSGSQFMLSCLERKRVVRAYFSGLSRLAGVSQVNFYDIPRNAARHWLDRAGLLGHWRALKRS